MRVAVSVLAAVLLVVGFIAVQANGWEKAAEKRSVRQFVVDCRIISEEPPQKDRRSRIVSQPVDLKAPPVKAREGEKASVADLGQTAFAIVRQSQGDVTRSVTSGTSIELVVTSVSNDRAILDVTAELSSPHATSSKTGQSVCVSFAKIRGIECVTLGEKTVFRLPRQDWRLEATVRAAQD
ncbi:MAG TPA: hypothetical protein VMV10_09480 [Pirellulales bacterium]|nr:hypothetical protein [Pirellulales bacterium]